MSGTNLSSLPGSMPAQRTHWGPAGSPAPDVSAPRETQELPTVSRTPLAAFLGDRCVIEEGKWVRCSALYRAYASYCRFSTMDRMDRSEFQRLVGKKFAYNRTRRDQGKQVRCWEGLVLKNDGQGSQMPDLLKRLENKVLSLTEEIQDLNRHIELLRQTNAEGIVRAAELACSDF